VLRRLLESALDDNEFATPEWIDWSNNRRLFEPIGYVLPADDLLDAMTS
jgi:hypothetical protein